MGVIVPPIELHTERLLLRQWRDEDYGPFAEMSADTDVMEFFPAVLDRSESDRLADRIRGMIDDQG